ncbi:MAG: hypothetical protein ACR2M1_03900 [Gemmatimonadaceae bacterium]
MAQEQLTEKTARKPRKPQRRGRSVVAALLAGFLIVAFAVIWRRSYGITEARRLADLDRRTAQLDAERARLAGVIRDESGRAQIAPAAEKLGMKVPDDRQVRIIHR